MRRSQVDGSTTDQRLLDTRGPSDWVHTDPWRVLRIQSEFVNGFGALAEIPDGAEVSLTYSGDDPRLVVAAGRSPYNLPVLPAGDFPVMSTEASGSGIATSPGRWSVSSCMRGASPPARVEAPGLSFRASRDWGQAETGSGRVAAGQAATDDRCRAPRVCCANSLMGPGRPMK